MEQWGCLSSGLSVSSVQRAADTLRLPVFSYFCCSAQVGVSGADLTLWTGSVGKTGPGWKWDVSESRSDVFVWIVVFSVFRLRKQNWNMIAFQKKTKKTWKKICCHDVIWSHSLSSGTEGAEPYFLSMSRLQSPAQSECWAVRLVTVRDWSSRCRDKKWKLKFWS